MNFSLKAMIGLMRPHQYVKNLFVFMPIFFVGKVTDPDLLTGSITAFIAFSLSVSAVYIINDYLDIEADREHPRKQHRPLASGTVSPKTAILLMLVLLVSGLGIMATLSVVAVGILLGYIVLNLAYSFWLKHVAILDVVIISTGFVLRLLVGATVTAIPLSMWIVIMTFLLALFMALAKRRDDVLIFNDTGKKMRQVIDGYTLQLIDSAMTIMAAVVIVAYILYTTSAESVQRLGSEYLYLTALFVIVGIMRYLQISFVDQNSGSPTHIVLSDRFLQITIVTWLATFGWIIYI
ncbi:MAG: decaprenyl-phosphate phosphoribosyltransferase [Gammaproteobacteria bacterium]|nr:decaprenyl-phosphate phosphoribosyltransferase [Gammaproteobacteria bacterium]